MLIMLDNILISNNTYALCVASKSECRPDCNLFCDALDVAAVSVDSDVYLPKLVLSQLLLQLIVSQPFFVFLLQYINFSVFL